MVTLLIGNDEIEAIDQPITYNVRINDVFNIPAVAASYTNEFVVPKTPTNSKIFEGLGLVGDTSKIPYRKTSVTVLYEGYPLIVNGWLNVRETTSFYNVFVSDGIVDFFKDIENKNLSYLDLSALNHVKDLETVGNSFDNEDYKYIIADYGGRTQAIALAPSETAIDIDYLTPSVRVKFLWDKIFETFGYQYFGSIFESQDFTELWMTYPKEVRREGGNAELLKGELNVLEFRAINPTLREEETNILYFDAWNFEENSLNGFQKTNRNTFVAEQTRNYRFKIKTLGYCQLRDGGGNFFFQPTYLSINDGANPQRFELGIPNDQGGFDETDYTINIDLEAGQSISFDIVVLLLQTDWVVIRIENKFIKIEVFELSFGEVDFAEALKDFTITDFVKEIIARFAIVPVIDRFEKKITFYTASERTEVNNAIDWTSKYINRQRETYSSGSYAQLNYFTHKYNDANEQFSNGFLSIDNKNLEDFKTIFSSKIYSHNSGFVDIVPIEGAETLKVRSYPTWQSQASENSSSGDVSVTYKSLTGRFYFLKSKTVNQPIKLTSQELSGVPILKNSYPLYVSVDTQFNELVPKYYKEYSRILQDMRIQEIELTLNFIDIINLDFTNLYFFEQESNYFMLNTLKWSSDGSCVGEFVRVKRFPTIVPTIIPS